MSSEALRTRLVGAGLVSVVVFPLVAMALRGRARGRAAGETAASIEHPV